MSRLVGCKQEFWGWVERSRAHGPSSRRDKGSAFGAQARRGEVEGVVQSCLMFYAAI